MRTAIRLLFLLSAFAVGAQDSALVDTNGVLVHPTNFISANGIAPLASPALTGNPTAPTASVGDNDTSISTTAFVTAAIEALKALQLWQNTNAVLTALGNLTGGNSSNFFRGDGAFAQVSSNDVPGLPALIAAQLQDAPANTTTYARSNGTWTANLPASQLAGLVSTGNLSGLLPGLYVGNGGGVSNIDATTALTGYVNTNNLSYFLSELSRANGQSLTGLVAQLAFTPTYSASALVDRFGDAYSANALYAVSTWTGHGQGVGVVTSQFNSIRLQVTNWTTSKPTQMRAVVRKQLYDLGPVGGSPAGVSNPAAWPIFADSGTISVTLTNDTTQTITLPLLSQVSSSDKLWVQITANGRWMPMRPTAISDSTNNVAVPAYTTGGSLDPASFVLTSQSSRFAVEFLESTVTNFTLTSDMSARVVEAVSASDPKTVAVSLPALYAVEGTELNVYFSSVLRESNPSFEQELYCVYGSQYEDFFRITPTTTTNLTTAWICDSYDRTNFISRKNISLNIGSNTNGQGVSRKVLIVGDSTTAGGQTITELTRMGGTNGFELVGIGTQGTSTNMHEGRSGWTVQKFYADATSPFVLSGAFDFNYYLTNNSLTLASNDWAIITLGINDTFSKDSDDEAYQAITNAAVMLPTMVSNMKSVVPGLRVGVSLISSYAGQDAFGDDYGALQSYRRSQRNRLMWNEYFTTNGVSGATIIPLNAVVDPKYGFPTATVVANARTGTTVVRQNNAVHPDTSGYYQIADEYYAFLKWFEQ